jgi:hypothetical protein
MRFFKKTVFLFVLAVVSYACYWSTLVSIVGLDGQAIQGRGAWMEILYMSDSMYTFFIDTSRVQLDYYGHNDPTNTLTYWSKGYYQKTGTVADYCTRTSLGLHPPPQPIYRCSCSVNLLPGPVADAGRDRYINIYARDTLDATGSQTYQNRPITRYHWRSKFNFFTRYHWRSKFNFFDTMSVTQAILNDSLSARPWFMLMVPGDYYFYLCVEDASGLSAWDTVRVHACPYGEPCEGPAVETPRAQPRLPDILVFPNPGHGLVNFIVPDHTERLVVYNISGRAVDVIARPAMGVMTWRPRGRPAGQGVYYAVFQLSTGRSVRTRPVVWLR